MKGLPPAQVDAADSAPHVGSMPGWHIVADLTPPELLAARRLRKVRVAVIAAVLLVIASTAGGYQFAQNQAHEAAAAVTVEQAIGDSLRAQQATYSSVTSLQVTINNAHAELATLMTSDVDVDALLGKIWDALPNGMTISQISATVLPQTAGSAPAGSAPAGRGSGAGALDTSNRAHIGTVSLAGTGTGIDDVPAFIDKLGAIEGVFDPFPTSNQADGDSTTYSLQLTLTDTLLTHLYAVDGDS